MSDETQDVVTRADALLAEVTPGAWEWDGLKNGVDNGHLVSYASELKSGQQVLVSITMDEHLVIVNPADAALIAAAPQLVRELVAEVERLRDIVAKDDAGVPSAGRGNPQADI